MSDQPVSRVAQAVLKTGAVLAASALALALMLHAPFIQSAFLGYALTTVQRNYGLTLDVARLEYKLATFRLGLAAIGLPARRANCSSKPTTFP